MGLVRLTGQPLSFGLGLGTADGALPALFRSSAGPSRPVREPEVHLAEKVPQAFLSARRDA
ncbi:hypothetical protein BIV25_30140 [Streptomyces sp. MUSC 14]|uniref:hypothetical protein n=1 Tax=Streptomyces sp. MUSC 14 TaxID=1354889 RepID=UPI0008F58069|nr:hypothetical protein [Streptomyces sp. MUSC 14]OIJ91389.1 hypothetical protein BIV25_30140 [Streptomyces sp. MUSC 14]